jgi:hypothetical protein
VETGLLVEALARRDVRTSFVSNLVLAGGLVANVGAPVQAERLLPGLATGDLKLALAHEEPGARYDLARVHAMARRAADGWRLSGRKRVAFDGAGADVYLVSARIEGPDALGVFIVPADTPGLEIETLPRVDGGEIGLLNLADVSLGAEALLGGDDAVLPRIRAAVDAALIAWCAELTGLMDLLLATTLEYTRTRTQFGKPLSANQVIRHRLADMSVSVAEARAVTLRAALIRTGGISPASERAAAAARAKVAPAALALAQEAVQMHGGIGVTEEASVGGLLKRIVALQSVFGSAETELRRHADLASAG